ncbi:Potassium voltage-gated channel subfamily S member 3 [Bienertia sinuspersici]
MEDLMGQFTFLSNQALQDKTFDPSNIEDLMKLFEIEAYKSWASMELECYKEEESAQNSMDEAEEELNSAMESAMEEFRRFEEEMEKEAMAEYYSLLNTGEAAKNMGKSMEKSAYNASKKYIEGALNSATNSMRSAWKGVSSQKVHPA